MKYIALVLVLLFTSVAAFAQSNGGPAYGGYLVNFGNNSVVIGYNSGHAVTSGAAETFLGYETGLIVTTGGNNTLVGYGVGSTVLTTGSGNIMVGTDNATDTFSSSTTNGTCIGTGIVCGSTDVALGYHALHTEASDSAGNTALGSSAMGTGTMTSAALYDTAVGNGAMAAITAGDSNTAVGQGALATTTSGASNTAVGRGAGEGNTTGNSNTAVGEFALDGVGAGSSNVAVGHNALEANTSASNNTVIGTNAGKKLTSGGPNTIMGASVASTTLVTGTGNILIGTSSSVDTNGSADTNSIAIGGVALGSGTAEYGISGTTTATTIYGTIANPNITTDATHTDASVCEDTTSHVFYYGSGTLGVCLGTSSIRYKHDVVELGDGLSSILSLKPVNFFYKEGHGDNGAREQYGFIAEEFDKVLPKLTQYDKDGVPNSVDIVGLVPILVKGMQEQQASIAAMNQYKGSEACQQFNALGRALFCN